MGCVPKDILIPFMRYAGSRPAGGMPEEGLRSNKRMTETKELKWNYMDTPIPKKGELLTNIHREKYKVVSVVRGRPDCTITLERVN